MVEPRNASDGAMSDARQVRQEINAVRDDDSENPTRTYQESLDPKSRRTRQTDVKGVGSSGPNHPEDDTASHHSDSSHGSRRSARNHDDPDGQNPVQYLDQDREELLRKIDELQEQLRRSGNISEKSAQASPLFPRPGEQIPTSQCLHHHPEPFPRAFGRQMPVPGACNLCSVHGHGKFPPLFPVQYPHQSPHPYFSGSRGPFDAYHQNPIFHHTPCACFHCYEKLQQSPAPAPCNVCFGDVRHSPVSCHHENSGALSSHNSRFQATGMPPSESAYGHLQAHQTRWPSDIDSVMSGFAPRASPKVIPDSRLCHLRAVVGGAPFFTCHNCFELLRVPKTVKLMLPQQQKVRCGACSALTSLAIVSNKLLISSDAETKLVCPQVYDGSKALLRDTGPQASGHANRPSHTFSSEDYDHSGYSMDGENREVESNRDIGSTKSREAQSFHSSSSSNISKDTKDSYRLTSHRTKGDVIQHHRGESLQELFERSTANRKMLLEGLAYLNTPSESESSKPKSEAPQNNLSKDPPTVTDAELSFNESSNTEVSLDSRDTVRDDALVGSTCDTIEESSDSDTEGDHQCGVSVNGHPLPKRSVKAAEKMAGPIQPGDYWYDYRAGFWGVMGGPCLGIILPFIEEFNYPMPTNCAAGNTGVFVNRRELHRKDLVLLASRGLPTERDRHYIVDISGRVLDGETGEELDCLGRLAPTVEKLKRGFGLKLPRASAQAFQALNPPPPRDP